MAGGSVLLWKHRTDFDLATFDPEAVLESRFCFSLELRSIAGTPRYDFFSPWYAGTPWCDIFFHHGMQLLSVWPFLTMVCRYTFFHYGILVYLSMTFFLHGTQVHLGVTFFHHGMQVLLIVTLSHHGMQVPFLTIICMSASRRQFHIIKQSWGLYF